MGQWKWNYRKKWNYAASEMKPPEKSETISDNRKRGYKEQRRFGVKFRSSRDNPQSQNYIKVPKTPYLQAFSV